MLDPVGKIGSWNPGAERIYGYSADEIIGTSSAVLCTSEDAESGLHERILSNVVRDGRFEIECARVRKDGSPFWAIVTVTDLRDSFGQHVGFAKVTRDITERKNAEQALKDELNLTSTIIDSLPCVFYLYDRVGRFVRWNKRFESVSKYSPSQILTSHPLDYFSDEDKRS